MEVFYQRTRMSEPSLGLERIGTTRHQIHKSESDKMEPPDHYDPIYFLTMGRGISHCSRVSFVDWDAFTYYRGGVIPYTVYDGDYLFGLGKDRKTGELGDFGGWVKYKKREKVVQCALREFSEETLGSFGYYSEVDVGFCPVLYNRKSAILFLHLMFDPVCVSGVFDGLARGDSEMSSIVWMRYNDIVDCLGNGSVYIPAGYLLEKIDRVVEIL